MTNNNIGISFFTVWCLTLIGLTIAAKPIIKKTFTIQLPMTLAKAMVPFFAITLLNDIATSGAQVPKDTMVNAINIFGTWNFEAIDDAASTRTSLALIIMIKPIIKNINSSI